MTKCFILPDCLPNPAFAPIHILFFRQLNQELLEESKHLGNGGTVIDFAAFNWATVSLCTQLKANKSVRSPPLFYVVFFLRLETY